MRQPPISPRKTPRQGRSRFTVDAIVEATLRILAASGARQLTTTRVAERAGVSVGTLYQYFPGREALLEAALRRHTAQASALLRTSIEGTRGAPLEARLRTLLGALLAFKRRERRLLRALAHELPRLDGMTSKRSTTAEASALIRALLDAHPRELPRRPSEAALFAAVHAVEGVCSAALDHPDLLASTELEALLATMALSALGLGESAARRSSRGPPRVTKSHKTDALRQRL